MQREKKKNEGDGETVRSKGEIFAAAAAATWGSVAEINLLSLAKRTGKGGERSAKG